jgi:hypothetical protein
VVLAAVVEAVLLRQVVQREGILQVGLGVVLIEGLLRIRARNQDALRIPGPPVVLPSLVGLPERRVGLVLARVALRALEVLVLLPHVTVPAHQGRLLLGGAAGPFAVLGPVVARLLEQALL